MFCTKCGVEINEELNKCPNCGNLVKNVINDKKSKAKKTKKPIYKRVWFWIIVICLGISLSQINNIDDTETRWEGTLGEDLQLSDLDELCGRAFGFTAVYYGKSDSGEYIFKYTEKKQDGTTVTVDFYIIDDVKQGNMSELDDKAYEDDISAKLRCDLEHVKINNDGEKNYYLTASSIEYID